MAESQAGRLLELTVGPPAHGGHCVARVDDDPHGRVVFVRHALPGERVRAVVTEDLAGAFCRADAIEILTPSADRVAAPCQHAGPGRCGGCDWQHASGPAQRAVKAAVVREQFARLAGLEPAVTVEELPGGLLGWRTRTVYATDGQGRLGLRRHRSHEVELIEHCPLGVAGVGDSAVLATRWAGVSGVEVATGDNGTAVLEHRPHGRPGLSSRPGASRQGRGRRLPDRVRLVDGPATLEHQVLGRRYEVSAGGFWQVHPQAAETFAAALLEAVAPAAGETVLDLYAGAGLFTALLADAVGPTGRVLGIEASRQAVADAAVNLAALPWAEVHVGKVTPETIAGILGDGDGDGSSADVVVLDPPRTGAGAAVMAAVLGLGARAVGYVACDPAALARDVRTALDAGWRLTGLRAFDAFPMTHHVECVAVLTPPDAYAQ